MGSSRKSEPPDNGVPVLAVSYFADFEVER